MKNALCFDSMTWKAIALYTESPLAGWTGRYINVQPCVGLSMVLLQLKDPLEQLVFVKRWEFPPGSISLRYYLSC